MPTQTRKATPDQLAAMFDDLVTGRDDHDGLSAGDVVNLILEDVIDIARDAIIAENGDLLGVMDAIHHHVGAHYTDL